MPQTIDLLGFFTLGLLGGFGHCVGMCSPFVLFVARRYVRPGAPHRAALAPQLWYSTGRIATYAILGAVAGGLGGVVELAGALLGVQRAAGVLAGTALIVWAAIVLLGAVPPTTGEGTLFTRVLRVFKGHVPGHPFATGLFLGLLPCGLVYSAAIAAAALGGAGRGAIALALFGLGTAPALLGVSLADELLARRRALLNRLSYVFLLLMGAWFVWSGLAR